MKRISILIIVLLFGCISGRLMAQKTDNRVPVRTSDPHPYVAPVSAVLPAKTGNGAQVNHGGTAVTNAKAPVKPGSGTVAGGQAGFSSTSGAAATTGTGATSGKPVTMTTSAAGGASGKSGPQPQQVGKLLLPPVKSASAGSVQPN